MLSKISGGKLKVETDDEIWSKLDYEDLLSIAEERGLLVVERPLPNLLSGLYSDSRTTILIDSRIRDWQKRVTLVHEMVHAEHHDAACASAPFSKVEIRTRTEVALRLIDPVEYRTSEDVREGRAYDMACDLNITVQCIRDYQRWLKDQASVIGRLYA